MLKIFKKRALFRKYSNIQNLSELEVKFKEMKDLGYVSFQPLASKDLHENTLFGISFCFQNEKPFYVPLLNQPTDFVSSKSAIQSSEFYPIIQNIFSEPTLKKVSHDIKASIKNLEHYDIKLSNFDDIMVMSYVLNCGKHGNDFDTLIEKILNTQIQITEKDVLGIGQKKKTFIESPVDKVSEYINQYSTLSLKMYEIFKEQMGKLPRLTQFYNNIELPLVEALAFIEIKGVFVDKESFKQMEEEYSKKIEEMAKLIHEKSGSEDLNINSPSQIGEILVEKMNIGSDVIKKSEKTGKYSSGSASLLKLKAEHELPKYILDYRALTKLYSTYIVGFQKHINPYTNRIHTTYQNALTVTGRLSSTAPNLQNIPNRNAEGRRIRQNIIVPPGYQIIKADYSQVELRILAHVANIPVLREAFKNGKDVHSITASQVFNTQEVTKELRQKAKAINFGIIYGMSEFGLSKQINVPLKQAKEYINLYFKQYPGIEKFMKNTKQFCKEHGYVNTLFGRRCWIPDINSDNSTKRGFAERTAINTPIQGTSADITKIAMNKCHVEFIKRNLKTRMIIQVHDEIVFEVPNEELEQVKELVKTIMEGVGDSVNFSIPLTVDVNVSDKWCE